MCTSDVDPMIDVPACACQVDQRRPDSGSTALHAAAFHGHADVISLLLSHGADVVIQKVRVPWTTHHLAMLFLSTAN